MQQSTSIGGSSTITLPTPPPHLQPGGDLQQTLPPPPQRPGTQGGVHSSPRTYKSQDLTVGQRGQDRLKKTLDSRQAKAARFKSPPDGEKDKVKTEKKADFKSRADKFFKEFKAVFKNLGKATKAGGDGAKYIGGKPHDSSQITGGIGAGAQIVETAFDLYLAKVKIDKSKADLATVEKFSPEVLKEKEERLLEMQDKIKATKKEIQGKIATTTTTLGEARAERDNIKDTAKQLKSSVKDLKAQLATLDAQISAKDGGPVDRGIVESRANIDSDLRDFETEADRLDTTLSEMDASIDTMDKSLTTLGERLQKSDDLLTDIDAVLKNLAVTGRMKGRNAEKDLTSYNDSVPLERAKMVKSLWDGQKAITDIGMLSSGAGTVAAEGFKLASGVTGVVVGPLTMAVNSYEMYNDVNERNVQLALKAQSTKVLKSTTGIKQDDGELLAIAERLKLKQTKQSVDKGLSATKNFFGALGGAGTAVAGGVAIAVTAGAVATTASAVLIATPIGWGLAGAAALAAIGYGIYKLARHVNSSGIKEALQTTLKNVQGKDPATKVGDLGLTRKDAKAMGKITDKMIKALAAQGITATADQFTVQDVQNYASKKLLARDTGVATASLYHRFKEETGAHFRQQGITNPTADDFDTYLKDRKAETPVSTAAGLISTLGFSMSKEEALDLYRDSSSSDSIKFLSKKLKLS